MAALTTVLVVAMLSLLVTRVATVVLVLTGMSRESARFQARSALTGVGFTTSEAESVVGHPVRRRVVMTLMLLGGAGVVTAIGSLFLTLSGADRGQALDRVAVLLGGLGVLLLLARSRRVDAALSTVIAKALRRWTDLDVADWGALLHLTDDFRVVDVPVVQRGTPQDVRDQGVVVLGIHRADGTWLGAPDPDTPFEPGDRVVAYGRREDVRSLGRPVAPADPGEPAPG